MNSLVAEDPGHLVLAFGFAAVRLNGLNPSASIEVHRSRCLAPASITARTDTVPIARRR
jgi:hypothetical protein